jgi:photosynthetic reaction center H subunit
MHSALSAGMDVAQVVLYVFWLFFFGLIWWLRMEDRREGYPLESDNPRKVGTINTALIPKPKTFLLPHGGSVQAPNFERDTRAMDAERSGGASGSAWEPSGDPMKAAVGPASFAMRMDIVETNREGHDLIVPMRVEKAFGVSAGPDPRGWDVVGTDDKVAGKVKDVWVDRADVMVRYLELELADATARLVPITMLLLESSERKVKVHALRAEHFSSVPSLKEPDRVTILEEEKITAFYAGGRMYAEPGRLGPLV